MVPKVAIQTFIRSLIPTPKALKGAVKLECYSQGCLKGFYL